MINVQSFEKMISQQQCFPAKNISKTSQFTFGQNYKKIISGSKATFDFRKILQKNHQKKNIASKEQTKRTPLQQVSQSGTNIQSLLPNKAFKIRCYSKKTTVRQSDNFNANLSVSKLPIDSPDIKELKTAKIDYSVKISSSTKHCSIKLHKFDNYELFEPISSSLRIFYNPNLNEQQVYDKAIILDLDYLSLNLKGSITKGNEKQRQKQFYNKKLVYLLKKIIQDDRNDFQHVQCNRYKQSKLQLIFKVNKQSQVFQLIKLFQSCEFKLFYCVFSVQNKYVESVGIYNLMKITNIAQNILLIDDAQTVKNMFPLVDSRHFFACAIFNDKNNFVNALQNLFSYVENMQIRYSAEQFTSEKHGQMIDLPFKTLIQRVKQKKNLKSIKKLSQQRSNRCKSSYQLAHPSLINQKQVRSMQIFKQKILKYLKIVNQQQKPIQSKKFRSFQTIQIKDQFQCLTGRQNNSKTNNQIVAELIRLNAHTNRQINHFKSKMQNLDLGQSTQQDWIYQTQFNRFQKLYFNYLNH